MPTTKKLPQPAVMNGSEMDVLTLSEAAAYLRLSEADVLRLIREQGLPARQLGNDWRLLRTAIQEWLSTGLPTLEARKAAILELAGKYKDDPDLEAITREAYRQRGRPLPEEEFSGKSRS